MVFPILVANVLTYEPSNQSRWLICMAAVAIFSALTIYLQFLFTRERGHRGNHGQAGNLQP